MRDRRDVAVFVFFALALFGVVVLLGALVAPHVKNCLMHPTTHKVTCHDGSRRGDR